MAIATVEQLRDYLDQVPLYAQQSVEYSGSSPYELSYEGQTTSPIPADATATMVQSALTSLSTVGVNKARVTGPSGGPWVVMFLAGNDASPLTSASSGVQITPRTDALLAAILARAESIVTASLGWAFDGYTTGTQTHRAPFGTLWRLPPHDAGSLTAIQLEDTAITDYQAANEPYTYYRAAGWNGRRYEVTADWGYGSAPAAIQEVVLEVAVNIWRSKDRGLFSDVIGVDGGNRTSSAIGVGYQGALTNQQKMVLREVTRDYLGTRVWA